ncbi:MAG: RNA-binding protein [Ruminococcaceae bacterium]|jgi:RNA-binding protein YlmH|nr:RNA-binding protein [Oscillospiraceae bacterium]
MKPVYLTDKQDKAFAAHITDLFLSAQQNAMTRFSGFLDMHQLTLARQVAVSSGYSNYLFFSGYPEGERAMLGVFSPYGEQAPFPIIPITLRFRKEDPIGHRDILGAFLGLEIRREAVGDILVGEGAAVAFVTESVAPILLNELKKVGHCGVKVCQGMPETLPPLHNYLDIPATVSSLRLDCIVAAIAGISREKSSQTIGAQLVFVNGASQSEPSWNVAEGDVISIRGFGKFLFASVNKVTKKGRLQILCKKYV